MPVRRAVDKAIKFGTMQQSVRVLQRLIDVLVLMMSFQAAYLLRFEFALPPAVVDEALR